jgi:hypothetical protein
MNVMVESPVFGKGTSTALRFNRRPAAELGQDLK